MELLRILAFVNMSKMVLGNSDTVFSGWRLMRLLYLW